LILGDASETFGALFARGIAPLGFVSFDMDHYTPTAAVLAHLDERAEDTRFLPRLPLYFDDVVGKRGQDYNVYTGELLAIQEFNEVNKRVKIDEDRYFRSLPLNFEWHHGCYTMHRFDHPSYDVYVKSGVDGLGRDEFGAVRQERCEIDVRGFPGSGLVTSPPHVRGWQVTAVHCRERRHLDQRGTVGHDLVGLTFR
jgi:hypothetical protein